LDVEFQKYLLLKVDIWKQF